MTNDSTHHRRTRYTSVTNEYSHRQPHGQARCEPAARARLKPGFLLKRLGFAIKDRTIEAFEAQGANPYHYSVLAVLAESAGETQAQIADALGYDRSWLVGLLDELEEEGLIERQPDPEDRRRNSSPSSPRARRRLAELRAISRSVEEEFLAPLDPAEREQLHAMLQKLASSHDPRYAPGNGPRRRTQHRRHRGAASLDRPSVDSSEMPTRDLREWIALLEREGELVRISAEVDPHLEITEIVDRTVRAGGPALLFEHPKGSQHPAADQPVRHRAAHVPRVRRRAARRRRGASSPTCSRCSRPRASPRRCAG